MLILPAETDSQVAVELSSILIDPMKDCENNRIKILPINCCTPKLSSDGSQQWALAIRAKQFQDHCKEIIVSH